MESVREAAANAPEPASAGAPAAEPAAAGFDPARQMPSTLFLSMSTSNLCNFRCRHCHIWLHTDPKSALSTADRVEVLRQFRALNPAGTVILPGGEVTLDFEELMTLAGTCKELGLPCLVVTNGSRLDDDAAADRFVASGITLASVSLDSHRAELHEYTRGVPGAFEQATGALRRLAAARDRQRAAFRLIAVCVVFDRNLELLDEYVEYCRGLGVDHVDLQLLSHTFDNAHPAGRDVFFEKHFWHTPEAKRHARQRLTEFVERHAGGGGFVVKNPGDLDWISSYIDDPGFRTAQPICASHEKNLVVDGNGDVALCFNSREILAEPFVGNVRRASLLDIWTGGEAARARRVMDRCQLGCGALNCHRRRPDG